MREAVVHTLCRAYWNGKRFFGRIRRFPIDSEDDPAADKDERKRPEILEHISNDALCLEEEKDSHKDKGTSPKDTIASHLDLDIRFRCVEIRGSGYTHPT